MTHAGQDVRLHTRVAANPHKMQGSAEVAACSGIVTGIVRHPARHLRDSRRSGEYRTTVRAGIEREESGSYLVSQVVRNRGVQVCATHP